jgi:hypothetical protein
MDHFRMGEGVPDDWAHLPNLVIVVVFLIAARALVQVNRYLFQEIREGTLKVHGFYPECPEPTAKLEIQQSGDRIISPHP